MYVDGGLVRLPTSSVNASLTVGWSRSNKLTRNLIRVLGLDVERPQDGVREVTLVVGDDQLGACRDACGQDMTVSGIGQVEPLDERFEPVTRQSGMTSHMSCRVRASRSGSRSGRRARMLRTISSRMGSLQRACRFSFRFLASRIRRSRSSES